MYSKLFKVIGIFLFLTFIGLTAPSSIKASCTYQATITDNHLDFKITTDTSNLGLIQYIRQSGSALITKIYSPSIQLEWVEENDPCNTNTDKPLSCRQNRGQLGDSAYWIWSVNGDGNFPNHLLPAGIWGLDFDSQPTYESIGIEYGSTDGGVGNFWQFCTRDGDVVQPSATPVPSPSLTPTQIPSPTPTLTPSPSPSPTPSPTPSPSPSPSLIPVTKVFLIPGIASTWNLDAFINCKTSGYAGGWTLAPYAKDVYEEILKQLPIHDWNTYPFYYDWRNDIRNNATKLNSLINSNTVSNEKVNIVGHSMGGLIGRNYLETESGGKASKFLAVGAPFAGSAYSYQTQVNGEVWDDDLVARVGKTLFIKHCGIPESIQNLLPTYNYIRDYKTKQMKDVSTMKTKNNYLPTNFVAPFWGVKVGTLIGAGESTLKTINVIRDPKWPDGKPLDNYNEYSNEGDGTVLVSSALLPGASSAESIYQSHSGIIASTEGVSKILEFLGSPGIADPPYSDPQSALILIGYPGTFWITDKEGRVTQSEQGMVSIMNPKSGDYQLQIMPTSNSTKFIAAQFLPNGKTLYKEYKFNGLVQEPKIIHFDSNHPSEDIVKNTRDYKKPNFPKYWRFFWNFWNKHH